MKPLAYRNELERLIKIRYNLIRHKVLLRKIEENCLGCLLGSPKS